MNDGIIGIAIIIPLSAFIAVLPKDANEIPCAMPSKIYADADTCCPRNPVYLAAITDAEIAKAFAI